MTKNDGYKTNLLDIHDNEKEKKELWSMGGGNDKKMSILDRLELPYEKETVESFGGKYTQEEIDIAEVIFAWWISGKGYTQWYAENISQQKLDFTQ